MTTVRSTCLALVLAAGCASDTTSPTPFDCPDTGPYLELRTGASWTYRVDDGTTITEKTQTVGVLEDVGGAHAGTMAYRIETTKPGGTVVSWQADTADAVVRYRELDMSGSVSTDETYQPYRTRISQTADHTAAGAIWTEDYTEVVTDTATATTTTADKSERWEVVAVDEPVTVPAGELCALRLRRTSTVAGTPGSDKTYWFVRGIGKVKEAGANQTEELLAHE